MAGALFCTRKQVDVSCSVPELWPSRCRNAVFGHPVEHPHRAVVPVHQVVPDPLVSGPIGFDVTIIPVPDHRVRVHWAMFQLLDRVAPQAPFGVLGHIVGQGAAAEIAHGEDHLAIDILRFDDLDADAWRDRIGPRLFC